MYVVYVKSICKCEGTHVVKIMSTYIRIDLNENWWLNRRSNKVTLHSYVYARS